MDWSMFGGPWATGDGRWGPGSSTALAVALSVAGAGFAARALTARGALIAALVGTVILTWSGWAGGAALAAFFLLSNVLPHLLPSRAHPTGDAKEDRRDARQVLANGGAAAIGAFVCRADASLALWTVAASLASAAADTWATVLGATSRTPPRLLHVGAAVPAGTNGGMTWQGSLGAVGGAGSVALAAGMLGGEPHLVGAATIIGVAGMLLDSVLGATLQGRHHCDPCAVASDWRVHRCGNRTRHVGGLAWLDNDAVNFASTGTAALAGALLWRMAHG